MFGVSNVPEGGTVGCVEAVFFPQWLGQLPLLRGQPLVTRVQSRLQLPILQKADSSHAHEDFLSGSILFNTESGYQLH